MTKTAQAERTEHPDEPPPRQRVPIPWLLLRAVSLALFLACSTFFFFLTTTGIPLDRLLPLATGRVADPGGRWQFTLQQARVFFRLHEGLIFTCRGGEIQRQDGSKALRLGKLRLILAASSLWRKNLVPESLTIEGLHLDFRALPDGSYELFPLPASPAATPSATPRRPVLPDHLLPREGLPFRLEILDFRAVFDQPSGLPPVQVEEVSCSVIRRQDQLQTAFRSLWAAPTRPVEFLSLLSYSLGEYRLDLDFGFSPVGAADVVAFLPRTKLPVQAEGALALRTSAVMEFFPFRLESFAFEGESEAIRLLAPDWFNEVLQIEPIVLSGAVNFAAGEGRIAPFTIKVGPLTVEFFEHRISESETIQMEGGVRVRECELRPWWTILSAPLREKLAFSEEDLAGLALLGSESRWKITLPRPPEDGGTAWERLEVHHEMRVQAGKAILETNSQLLVNGQRSATLDVRLHPFTVSAAAIPLLEKLPLQALDLPVEGEIHAEWGNSRGSFLNLAEPQAVQVELRAGTGMIRSDDRWVELVGPLPLQQARLRMEFDAENRTLRLPVCGFALAGPEFWGHDLEVSLDQPFEPHSTNRVFARGRFSATEWLAEDLWPWLSTKLRKDLPVTEKEAGDVGLRQLEGEFTAQASFGSETPLVLEAARLETSSSWKTGAEDTPLQVLFIYDPNSQSWQAELTVPECHPGNWRLAWLDRFPIPQYGFTSPVGLQVKTGISFPWRQEDVFVNATIGRGQLAMPGFLAQPLPIEKLLTEIRLDPGTGRIAEFSTYALVAGCEARMRATDASFQEGRLRTTVEATAHGLTLDAILPYWKEDLLPEIRQRWEEMHPAGKLDSARVSFAYDGDPASFAPSQLRELQYEAQWSDLQMALAELPTARIQQATVFGTDALMRTELTDLSFDCVQLPRLTLTIGPLFADERQVHTSGEVAIDLAGLTKLVRQLPVSLPEVRWEDYSTLGGFLRGSFDAGMPLGVGPFQPDALRATLDVRIEDFELPLTPAQSELLTVGKGQVTAHLNLADHAVGARIEYFLSSVRAPGILDGPARMTLEVGANSRGEATLAAEADLSASEIRLAPLQLFKEKGGNALFSCHAKATGWLEKEQSRRLDFAVDYDCFIRGGATGMVEFTPQMTGPNKGFARATLDDVTIGRTVFDASLDYKADNSWLCRIDGSHLEVPEIVAVLTPFLRQSLIGMAERQAQTAATPTAPPPPFPFANLVLRTDVNFQEVVLAQGKRGTGFESSFLLQSGQLQHAEMNGSIGRDLFYLTLAEPQAGQVQAFSVILPDVISLAEYALTLLEGIELPDSPLARNLETWRKIPKDFRGGILVCEGRLQPQQPDALVTGHLRIDDFYMMNLPCLVRGIAQCTLKPAKAQAVFSIFDIQSFTLGRNSAVLDNLRLQGPVDLWVKKAEYLMTEPRLKILGEHALVAFEVDWPMRETFSSKFVLLTNKLIRTLGQEEDVYEMIGP